MSEYDTDAQSDALLAAFQARFDPSFTKAQTPTSTGVLNSASFINSNAIDVHISMLGVRCAAQSLYSSLQKTPYDFATWHAHALHPSIAEFGEEGTAEFVFVMDLLNFCFWSDGKIGANQERSSQGGTDEAEHKANVPNGFAIDYQGQMYTGYWSLVAALRRAIEEGVPITDSTWLASDDCTLEAITEVFRSAGSDSMPLLRERWQVLKEAGKVLEDCFDSSVFNLIESANHSAVNLINTLVSTFPCFNDTHTYEGETVRFHKRAQIFVADLWACFEGKELGRFDEIEQVTMFADYRIPQMLYTLGCLEYSPPLTSHIRSLKPIASGHNWEIELRGCSIWTVELLRREIETIQQQNQQFQPHESEQEQSSPKINAILIDFFLYDMVKAIEKQEIKAKSSTATGNDVGEPVFGKTEMLPHHRTRSIWY